MVGKERWHAAGCAARWWAVFLNVERQTPAPGQTNAEYMPAPTPGLMRAAEPHAAARSASGKWVQHPTATTVRQPLLPASTSRDAWRIYSPWRGARRRRGPRTCQRWLTARGSGWQAKLSGAFSSQGRTPPNAWVCRHNHLYQIRQRGRGRMRPPTSLGGIDAKDKASSQ